MSDGLLEADGWLWIAKSVAYILDSAEGRSKRYNSRLRAALRESLDLPRHPVDIEGRALPLLEARFGKSFLEELKAFGLDVRSSDWTRRDLSRYHLSTRVPDLLRMLMLTAAAVEDVSDLESMELERVTAPRVKAPVGYGRRVTDAAARLDPRMISQAIASAGGNLTRAAREFKLQSQALSSAMLALGIRHPMTKQVEARLGMARIGQAKKLLLSGEAKSDICTRLRISSWYLVLIQLDEPSLWDAHRVAIIERQRRTHRSAVLEYSRLHPDAGREAVAIACKGSASWLRKFDKQWFCTAIAPVKRVKHGGRPIASDWGNRDEAWAEAIACAASAELTGSAAPRRLTKCRLLREVKALPALGPRGAQLLPLTVSAAIARSEAPADYERRRIRWALERYQGTGVALSMKHLKTLASMPPAKLRNHREYVLEEGERLLLTFHPRFALLK